MADRRMLSIKITNSARFLKLPMETQALYFHLCLRADDDGIVEAFSVARMVGASEDSIKLLIAKDFIKVLNEDLVAYITHWREHNKIRADRKIDSIYKDLLIQIVPELELVTPVERSDVKDNSKRVKYNSVDISLENNECDMDSPRTADRNKMDSPRTADRNKMDSPRTADRNKMDGIGQVRSGQVRLDQVKEDLSLFKNNLTDGELDGCKEREKILLLDEKYFKITEKRLTASFKEFLEVSLSEGFEVGLLWTGISRSIDKAENPCAYAKTVIKSWGNTKIKTMRDLEAKENMAMGNITGAKGKKPTHENFDQRDYGEEDLEKYYVNVNE